MIIFRLLNLIFIDLYSNVLSILIIITFFFSFRIFFLSITIIVRNMKMRIYFLKITIFNYDRSIFLYINETNYLLLFIIFEVIYRFQKSMCNRISSSIFLNIISRLIVCIILIASYTSY